MRAFWSSKHSATATIVVGEGLIGEAVSRRRRRRAHHGERESTTDWRRPESLGAEVSGLLPDTGIDRIEVVWAAGTIGMDSNANVDRLLADFRTGLTTTIGVAAAIAPVRLHLLSSAGALGGPNGSRFSLVDSPYKHTKQGQEEIARDVHGNVRIHRITSVYGSPRVSERVGVVGALVRNALRGTETPLYASTSTMRNYVHTDDVAEALIRALDDDDTAATLLASDRSHPISEVVSVVQSVVRRPVPIAYRPATNDHDMVFEPAAVSHLMPQRPLVAGVRKVFDDLISR